MASFLENLWNSIFTPGPTPTLLIATNATFAALQLTLFALLIGTASIHFAILSFLCGGLWYSINWFATELAAATKKEEEAERLRARKRRDDNVDEKETENALADADDEGEDTEVEGNVLDSTTSLNHISAEETRDAQAATASATGTQVLPQQQQQNVSRQRNVEDVDRSGDMSTDSEWEKVDDEVKS